MCADSLHRCPFNLYSKLNHIMQEDVLLKICLEYALSKVDEIRLNQIIASELDREEKTNSLLLLNDDKTRVLLLKLGFNRDFLKTL